MDTTAAKSDLVSLLVHDLRSPVAGQIALLELVLDELGAERSQVRHDIEEALRVGDEVFKSLEEVLQVRLLEDGELPVHRQAVELRALFAKAISTLEGVARKRGVALKRRIEGADVATLDGNLVRRSVENLLSNALRYTPSGGDVLVRARRAGPTLEIAVADRGPGVPDDLKGLLFEKFGSLETRRGRPRAGFGLGLHLVKLVAQGHGGAVSVQDRPGGGSVFSLRLPA